MAQPATHATIEDLRARLDALGPLEKGEIIGGELHVQPRPRFRHGRANTFLARHLGGAFDFDASGPGGWWIVVEPGIELPGALEISPDLAGWRRERMPEPPVDRAIDIVPDWVCEVMSPSNARYDRLVKLPYYASVGVPRLWLVDSRDQTLEVFELREGAWSLRQSFGPSDTMTAPPFEPLVLRLEGMWSGVRT